MIKVTLEFKSLDDAIVALGKLAGIPQLPNSAAPAPAMVAGSKGSVVGENGPSTPAAAEPTKRGRGRPRKNAAPAPAVAAEVSGPVDQGPQAGAESPATGNEPGAALSVEDVQAVVQKLFDTKGFNICAEELARFGVKRAKDLKPEQRTDFIRNVNHILNGGLPA